MIQQIWSDFLQIANIELGTRAVETWLKAVSIARYDSSLKRLYLNAPNAFVKDWICRHYFDFVATQMKRLLHVQHIDLIFSVGSADAEIEFEVRLSDEPVTSFTPVVPVSVQAPSHEVVSFAKQKKEVKKSAYKSAKKLVVHQQSNRLNQLYTFDSFVVGENNSFAYVAARAIVDKLGTLYNPFLLYGRSGLGKTHLLHAIGNQAVAQDPTLTVLYQTTDRFINEFINAIRFNHVQKFQAKYHEVDLLLIDDIQFMAKKEQTQEIFFHIFNHLYDAKKQIVFSSDTLPKDLGGLADRLRSRLEWGLVADVQMPSLETKIAILKRKAFAQGAFLEDEAALAIAQKESTSVRELEGSLIRVMAFSALTEQKISKELVEKVLGVVQEKNITVVDFQAVMKLIKKQYSYSLIDLRSQDRSKDISLARQVAMYLMKQYTKKSLREIGEFLDRKDHTTIAHAIGKIEHLKKDDAEFASLLQRMEKELCI